MTADIFGNLTEWGRVLDQLEQLKSDGLLDEHQAGLARILRYPDNWRLTEFVLACAIEIRQANDLLIAEATRIFSDQNAYLEVRLLATRALGHLLTHRPPQSGSAGYDPKRVIETMEQVANEPGIPRLKNAIQESLEFIQMNLNG